MLSIKPPFNVVVYLRFLIENFVDLPYIELC